MGDAMWVVSGALLLAAIVSALVLSIALGATPGGPSVCTVEQAWRCSDSALARLPQSELEPAYRTSVTQ